jgi:hypothetical protein
MKLIILSLFVNYDDGQINISRIGGSHSDGLWRTKIGIKESCMCISSEAPASSCPRIIKGNVARARN